MSFFTSTLPVLEVEKIVKRSFWYALDEIFFYIDGLQSGSKKTLGLADLLDLGELQIGYSTKHGALCNCDLAEIQIHDQVLEQQQIHQTFSKFVVGEKCP